jgi:hypothetical protein
MGAADVLCNIASHGRVVITNERKLLLQFVFSLYVISYQKNDTKFVDVANTHAKL